MLESNEQPSQTRGRSTQKRPLNSSSQSKGSQPKSRVRVRESGVATNESDTRRIARSPTPGSTDVEPEEPHPITQATSRKLFHLYFCFIHFLTDHTDESQYTYVYESPGYETLLQFAEKQLGGNSASRTNETLQKLAKANLTPSLETQRRGASVRASYHAVFFSLFT
jgi:hypothetical protein